MGVDGEGLQGNHGQQKDDCQAAEQNAERDFVGRLLARGAFDQGDHAIQKSFAGVGGDADLDPVRQHLRAAGHGRAVAASLADHRRRFAGNGRFVHRGHALNHLAVAGDVAVRLDVNHISGAQQRAWNFNQFVGVVIALGDGFALGLAQGVGLGLAAALGHGLGKVGEEHREPQPERDLEVEAEAGVVMDGVVDEQQCGQHATHLDDKHHRVLGHAARIELAEGIEKRLAHDFRIPKTFLFQHNDPFRPVPECSVQKSSVSGHDFSRAE